jgi:periplasmic protein TonB
VFNLLSESNLTRSARRRALTLSVFVHVVSTAIIVVFHIVHAASVPVRFVTELEVARASSGPLYLPRAPVIAPTAKTEVRRISLGPPVDAIPDTIPTPIATEIQGLAGNDALDPGRLPVVPAIHTMEAPTIVLNPPEPVPEPEPLKNYPSVPEEPAKTIVRVGGRVIPPQIISQQKPIYPENARRARVEGAVTLSGIVSSEGTLQEIRVVSGHPLLIEAALDCVRKWRYRPGTLNEQPIEMPITIRIVFVLNFK